ncbi:dienelactone hydrolase family protein [Halomonas sp. A11-A]|uniref:dienelactone hydrolase family protein n=1 Tax=Halomonas sp. A11-A TaxID=2183985 RepID=UPI000D9FBFE6|nr:dienelactone hydrolase family protein [Halomonas sp. A11-A]PWV71781.1 dienelactone hydrolase family protein [Halomonas sp. A11-A]
MTTRDSLTAPALALTLLAGAPHAFTVFGSDAYRERADERSWAAFLDLLEEAL